MRNILAMFSTRIILSNGIYPRTSVSSAWLFVRAKRNHFFPSIEVSDGSYDGNGQWQNYRGRLQGHVVRNEFSIKCDVTLACRIQSDHSIGHKTGH